MSIMTFYIIIIIIIIIIITCIIIIIILSCNKGLYGVDCNEKCGYCVEINQCHHIHGTCLTGCAAGYMGNMCKTRMYTCTYYTVQFSTQWCMDKDMWHIFYEYLLKMNW